MEPNTHPKKDATHLDITLSDPQEQPTDTISSIVWSTNSDPLPTFATSSWDSHIRIYQVNVENRELTQKACFNAESPALCVNWHEDMSQVYTGCTSGTIKSFDVETSTETEIGSHKGPVKDVYWVAPTNTLCSVSFDKTLRFWDLRQSEHIGELRLDYKPFCSDVYQTTLALGLSEGKVAVIDLVDAFNLQGTLKIQYMDSQLGPMAPLSTMKFFADGEGIGMGCVEGRCNISRIEAFAPKLVNMLTWKSHKFDVHPGREGLHQVNCMDFNKKNKEFIATAGGEGKIFFWNIRQKMKSAEFDFGGRPCTNVRCSPDGNLVAYALGNDWARGIQEHDKFATQVVVHVMKDEEFDYIAPTHIKYGL